MTRIMFKKPSPDAVIRWILIGWVLFCLIWAVAARTPGATRAFEAGGVKQVPVREYMAAGLWIGLVISGGIGVVLLLLKRWWGGAAAAPVRVAGPAGDQLRLCWFWLAMAGHVAGFLGGRGVDVL